MRYDLANEIRFGLKLEAQARWAVVRGSESTGLRRPAVALRLHLPSHSSGSRLKRILLNLESLQGLSVSRCHVVADAAAAPGRGR